MHYVVKDFSRLILFIGCLLRGITLFWYANDGGYFYHDKLTTVHATPWVNGEYKECTTLDVKEADEHPELSCETTGGEGKVFKVRFYGRTFAPERKQITSNWRCNHHPEEDGTTITCHMVAPHVSPTT